jgi:cytochrome c oxidase subunit IV
MAHINRKQYWLIFGLLAFLTALEVGIVKTGIAKTPMVLALIGLAITKAALVGLYFMHLKWETKPIKLSVVIPMTAPALYAVVLMADAAWRRLP